MTFKEYKLLLNGLNDESPLKRVLWIRQRPWKELSKNKELREQYEYWRLDKPKNEDSIASLIQLLSKKE